MPAGGTIIFDEAHKFLNAARQMYGMSFESAELERLSGSALRAIGNHNPDKLSIIRLCEELLRQNALLFDTLKEMQGFQYEKGCDPISFDYNCISALRAIELILRRLSILFFTLNREKKSLYDKLVSRIAEKQEIFLVLLESSNCIYWMELIGVLSCRVCVLKKQLDFLLFEDIWSKETAYILTSGTLSVSGNFSHFERRNGITFAPEEQLFHFRLPELPHCLVSFCPQT